jgi:hypothetical protein
MFIRSESQSPVHVYVQSEVACTSCGVFTCSHKYGFVERSTYTRHKREVHLWNVKHELLIEPLTQSAVDGCCSNLSHLFADNLAR